MNVTITMTIEEAKERVRIHDLWPELGYEGKPGKTCRSPFREDRHPSFSVYDDGRKWKDHATDEGGDVIDFYAKAKGITNDEACREILKRAGGYQEPVRHERPKQAPARLELPPAIPWDRAIAQAVADSRGLSITSVEFAALWLGILMFGTVKAHLSWILFDRSRRCAEARRVDGEFFPEDGKNPERKVHTLYGSDKSCPIGLFPPAFEGPWLKQHVHKILLVEGGPDLLAACQIIAAQDVNILPVAMLGAGLTIAAGALPYFKERQTVVVAQPGQVGRAAGERWRQQIKGAGGSVRLFALKCGDLNETVTQGATLDDLELF